MVLFIIKNGTEKELYDIFRHSIKGDKVILIQDAVLVPQKKDSEFIDFIKKNEINLFLLKEDCELRGLKKINNSVLVDYNGFLDLILKEKVFS